MKVLAALVTSNRCQLLERCIKHLKLQTKEPYEILVVNNGSTDNTEFFLKKNNIKFINQNNLGSAGGWHTAIDYAIKNNFEYIWLMDDDGYPEKYALEKLIKNFKKDYSCISSIVIDEKDHTKLVFPMPLNIKKNIFNINIPFIKLRDYNFFKRYNIKFYNFCHLFNGALLRISDLKNIGNVNKEYFLYGDEVDYYYRLNKIGKLMTLVNCHHFHPQRAKSFISTNWVFYSLKNGIINNFKYRLFPNFYNLTIIIITLLRILYRNGYKDLLSYLFGNKSKYYYTAIILGYKKSIGKNKPK
tara:strand:- start:4103 stop:5002 length:900 start_codon:yes stop_codon:yes gene_type:complete